MKFSKFFIKSFAQEMSNLGPKGVLFLAARGIYDAIKNVCLICLVGLVLCTFAEDGAGEGEW